MAKQLAVVLGAGSSFGSVSETFHVGVIAFISLNYDMLFEHALDSSGDYPVQRRVALGLDW